VRIALRELVQRAQDVSDMLADRNGTTEHDLDGALHWLDVALTAARKALEKPITPEEILEALDETRLRR
jgi:hypothetical protein